MVPERGCNRRPNAGSSSYNEDQELLEDLVEDLKYLNVDIDSPHIDDMPRQTQRHVAGVGEWFGSLIRKMARAIGCYHDNHSPHD